MHSCQKHTVRSDPFVIAKKRSGEQSKIFPDQCSLPTMSGQMHQSTRAAGGPQDFLMLFRTPLAAGFPTPWQWQSCLIFAWSNGQRNPAQTEHGLRGKASTWISEYLCLLTPYKNQFSKKTMSPKIHQNSMPCSACWTKWLIVFVGGWEAPFQVSHKQCSLSWDFPVFLRFRVPSFKQTLMCTLAKLQ